MSIRRHKQRLPGATWGGGLFRPGAGLTLMEYLVALGIGSLVLLVLVPLVVFSGRSFASLAHYADLNATGIYALDRMTKDIRQAVFLAACTSNQLTFNMGTGQPALVFTYDPGQGTLTRQQGATSQVLLTGCDAFQFSLWQRTPKSNSFELLPPVNAPCKVVEVNWTCSRQILGRKLTTEGNQSARIVIRNHPGP